MPYISIKSFPKDPETKQKIVERINELFLEVWGCQQKAITISMEEVSPDDWPTKIIEGEIKPNEDKMWIMCGEKKF